MGLYDYKFSSFLCPECGWGGPGNDCKTVDCLETALIIGCPSCETRITTVPYQKVVDSESRHASLWSISIAA